MMAAGIMAAAVDVRDMTCAQALAQAGRAVKSLDVGQAVDILCNAPDVKDDLLIWARELGHVVPAVKARGEEWAVTVQKGR